MYFEQLSSDAQAESGFELPGRLPFTLPDWTRTQWVSTAAEAVLHAITSIFTPWSTSESSTSSE